MMDDCLTLLALQRRSLNAVTGVGHGLLVGTLGNGEPLKADIIPGAVHHQEHAVEAAVLLAKKITDGAFVLPVLEHRRRRRLDAELLLDRQALNIIAPAEAAIVIDEEFRHDEKRDPLHARRRVGKARENEMDDVLAHVVFAVGDIDLLPADPVMITLRGRRRPQRREIGTGLRFRQVHRAGPFTGIQLRKIGRLLGVVADNLKSVDGALRQKLA